MSDKLEILRCKFCHSYSRELFSTLYDVHICTKCDKLIRKHGISYLEAMKSSDIEELKREAKDRLRKEMKDRQLYHVIHIESQHIHIPIESRVREKPSSRTLKAVRTRAVIQALTLCLLILTVVAIKASLSPALISALLTFFICRKALTGLYTRQHERVIAAELEESRMRLLERQAELDRIHDHKLDEVVQRQLSRMYPQALIRLLNILREESILLHEYELYQYPADWKLRTEAVRKRDRFACRECGSTSNLVVHHLKPVQMGGDHFLSNLVTLCNNCHLSIHPSIMEDNPAF